MLFSQSLAAFIVSWNRDLTHEELLKVSSYLIDGSTAPKESLQIKVATNTNTAPTNAGNTPTYFSWKLAPANLKEMPCSDFAVSCLSTSNMAAEDTCSKNGLQIVIPRSRKHFDTMINRFGKDPFRQAMASIYKPRSGESYTFVAMNSGVMPENGYKALDGGEWWIRDTKYGEPNGDYTKGDWLGIQNVENHPFTFNDITAGYKTNSYICSDNNPDHTRVYLNPPTGTIAVPSAQQSLAGSVIFATSSERISQEVAPTSILYSVSIKACNAANECSDAFTMPTITSDKFESSERTCSHAKKCDWSCPVISNDHSSGLSGQFFNIKKSCSGLTKSESILSIQQTRTIVSELSYKGVPPAEKWTTNGAHSSCNDPKYYGIGSPTGSMDRSVCLTQLNNGWLQLDLGAVKTVVSVVTTGRTEHTQYVSKYTITVSNDGSTFTNAPCVQKDSNGYCNGNTDQSTENTNILAGSITARFVRLNVKAYTGYASLRMGVYVKI